MLLYICFQLAFNDSAKYEWFTSKDKLSSSLDPKKPKLQDLKPEFWTFKQEGFFFTPEKFDIGKQNFILKTIRTKYTLYNVSRISCSEYFLKNF